MWLRGIIAALVLAAAAYSGLWYRHAAETKAQAVAFIQNVNQQDHGVSLKYDDLSIGGFPRAFTLRLHHPVLSLDGKTFAAGLAAQAQGGAPAATPDASAPVWTETAEIEGDLILHADYFSRSFTLSSEGPVHGLSQIGDTHLGWKQKGTSTASCTLGLTREASLSMLSGHMFINFSDPETLLKHFRSFECTAAPMELVDAESDAMLYRAGTQHLSLSSSAQEDNSYRLSAAVTLADVEASDAWQIRNQNIMRLAMGAPLSASGLLPLYRHEAIGKQNLDLKFSYRGPANPSLATQTPILLDIPTFTISNQLYSFSLPGKFSIDRKETQAVGSLSLNGRVHYAPSFDRYMNETFDRLAQDLYAGTPTELAEFGAAIAQKMPQEEFRRRLGVLAGTSEDISFGIDAGFKGAENSVSPVPQGEANISRFEVRVGEEGLSLTGSAVLLPPKGQFTLHCYRCGTTVEHLAAYLANLQHMFAALDPSIRPLPEDETFRNALSGFVASISAPAPNAKEESDRIITLSSGEQGDLSISGQPANEVMARAMEQFAPYLAPAAGPAGNE